MGLGSPENEWAHVRMKVNFPDLIGKVYLSKKISFLHSRIERERRVLVLDIYGYRINMALE